MKPLNNPIDDTHVLLNRSLTIRLLQSIREGQIDLDLFPELQSARRAVIQRKMGQYTREERRQIVQVNRLLREQLHTSWGQEQSQANIVRFDGAVSTRLLKAMHTGVLAMEAFPELRSAGEPRKLDLSGFSPDQRVQIRAVLAMLHERFDSPNTFDSLN